MTPKPCSEPLVRPGSPSGTLYDFLSSYRPFGYARVKRYWQVLPGSGQGLSKAAEVLVFSSVIKAGLGIGGEYGEGALRIGGKTGEYYNTAAASLGFQITAQSNSVLLVFPSRDALSDFRKSEGWKAGVDGSVAVVKWGVGAKHQHR